MADTEYSQVTIFHARFAQTSGGEVMATQGFGTAPVLSDEERQVQVQMLEQRLDGSAKWFYWIAALSVINAGLIIGGAGIRFIIGMGITDVAAAIGGGSGSAGIMAAIVVTAFAAGLCALFGYLGLKKHAWVFWVGMLLYAIDGAILVLIQDYLSAAFHAYVLYNLFLGAKALKELKALEAMGPPVVTAKPIA
jgi:hypothetical protein